MNKCEVGSIRTIHERLVTEGYDISEHALRGWVKDGTIPALFTGKKALISYTRVLESIKSTCGILT